MIFKTAYDTTACSGMILKRTVEGLQEAQVYGYLAPIKDSNVLQVESHGAHAVDNIPAFAHPIIFTDTNKEERVVFDARNFGTWDSRQGEFVIRSQAQIEYSLNLYRSELNYLWAFERPELLRDISQLPMAVYSAWVSEQVARRFALDPREQFLLCICAAIFYGSLFTNETELDEREKTRLGGVVARTVRAKAEEVFEILDRVALPKTVGGFCEMAAEITGSVRLKDLNAGVLFAIVGGTWFGSNAKEMTAVALEHPPTWIAILASALRERSYKNSTIAKTAERFAGRNADEFLRAALQVRNHA